MVYVVRLMSRDDVTQATAIDREAFPTMWPPTNFQHELRNRLAHYIVVTEEPADEESEVKPESERCSNGITARVRQWFQHKPATREDCTATVKSNSQTRIFGFSGFWIMADEAHITSIAVEEKHRHRGIGTLLLIATIEMAIELGARMLTLEVRVTNTIAQNLYREFGFNQVGIRPGYYTDNREDAVLMSTDEVKSPVFREHFEKTKKDYEAKWGKAIRQLQT